MVNINKVLGTDYRSYRAKEPYKNKKGETKISKQKTEDNKDPTKQINLVLITHTFEYVF